IHRVEREDIGSSLSPVGESGIYQQRETPNGHFPVIFWNRWSTLQYFARKIDPACDIVGLTKHQIKSWMCWQLRYRLGQYSNRFLILPGFNEERRQHVPIVDDIWP